MSAAVLAFLCTTQWRMAGPWLNSPNATTKMPTSLGNIDFMDLVRNQCLQHYECQK